MVPPRLAPVGGEALIQTLMESKGTVQGVNVAVATEFPILVLVGADSVDATEMDVTQSILGRIKWIQCHLWSPG